MRIYETNKFKMVDLNDASYFNSEIRERLFLVTRAYVKENYLLK
jgi:hypothetical protein